MRNIVNIVNFIRGCEPRERVDLVLPVKKQLELLDKYGFRGTFLLQYDALTREDIVSLLRGGRHELGVWMEVVEPQARAAGIEWRGRYPWDWHADVGFTVGYTPRRREELADALFEKFRAVFGEYPKVAGCWQLDAHTLGYIRRRYGVEAFCNCKEQWGTDGYTLWGGYWNGGYYPCKSNMLCPAQSRAEQIDLPVFRMLGSDPIHQYDCGMNISSGAAESQSVVTLEPVYAGASGGGGVPAWVDWYFGVMFGGAAMGYAYAQAGQENSFGWERMRSGLEYQFEKLAASDITVETLGETGRWFSRSYAMTPPTALAALSDWAGKSRSVWFNCKNYRANLFTDGEKVFFRDIHMFDESYEERYLRAVCRSHSLVYDCLPVTDGNRFSGGGIRAGLYIDGARGGEFDFWADENEARVRFGGGEARFSEDGIELLGELSLRDERNPLSPGLPAMGAEAGGYVFVHNGKAYRLLLRREPGRISIGFARA